jgi:predicted dehydrogenase
MKIGIIGAGVISEQYLENLTKAKAVSVEMIADLDISRKYMAGCQMSYGGARWTSCWIPTMRGCSSVISVPLRPR